MRTIVLCLTVLGCALAVPNGYYHQEYNYKTSASAYKNNELQHKTDDQGYYRKDGDLEGRVRPRVDANSEHSEYVNPNLRNSDYNTGVIGAANGDLSSYGHLRADVGAHGSRDHSEGLAHSDHIAGARGAYSDYNAGSSYGSSSYGSSSQSYGTTSNLRTVTSRLQQELQRDLENALQERRGYSQSSQIGISELEAELRQNVTNRLNAELATRYGQQGIRGGLSYTITGGRLHSTANYDNRELQDLRRQMEDSLLNQLRSQYRQSYSSQSQYENYNSHRNVYGYTSTTARPYYTTTYYRPTTTIRPNYLEPYIVQPSHTYTPVSNAASLTTIASNVQTQLDSRLNQILEDVERRYFSSSSSYSLTNFDVVLERLRNELRQNISAYFNDEVARHYGTQISRDGNMYTVGANGGTTGQYNYAVQDFENLRSQIERNLIEKLNRDFERYRSRWSQQYSHSYNSGSNVQYNTPRYDTYSTPRYDTYSTPRYDTYSTPRYDTYSTPRYTFNNPRYDYSTPHYNTYDSDVEHLSTRPSSSNIASLISPTGGNQYNHVKGSRQSGYEISGSSSSASMSQLQRQLQQDLSRQLQTALSRGHYGSYSASGAYNPQTYQVSLQQLTDELNRNLTRQLQEYSASGSYAAYGNFDQAQMASLRSQLQADLLRQLQQGLQESYSSSSSYSASSSSSSHNANYRPVRGFDNYQQGQYRSGSVATMQGEDCVGDDPNAYHSHRMKRSYQPYRSQPLGLGNSGGYGANRDYNYGYGGNFRRDGDYGYTPYGTHQRPQQQVEELGQQVDDSDLTQQAEELGQQVDNSDLTQQVEDVDFDRVQLGSQDQQQAEAGQQVDNSDLTQQVEDADFGRIQLGSQNQQLPDLGQQVDDSDLTQQVEDSNFGGGHLGSHSQLQTDVGQQIDDSDLTQQEEDSRVGRIQSGSHSQQQVEQDTDLTQQVEDSGLGKLQLGSHGQQQIELGQQIDDSDLTQQVEDVGFGRVSSGSQSQHQAEVGQQVDDSGFERVELGNPSQQQIETGHDDNLGLTQQVEDSGFGGIEQGQQEDNYYDLNHKIRGEQSQLGLSESHQVHHRKPQDFIQQVEENTGGRLQFGSQGQQQITQDELKLNQPQVEIAKKLEEDLSKQLNEAINNQQHDIAYSSTDYQSRRSYYLRSYEQLLNELQSNLTKQLQQISRPGREGSSYSYAISGNFNDQQIAKLRESIQYDLKKQLQKNLQESYSYTISNSHSRQFGYNQIDYARQIHENDLDNLESGNFKDFNQKQVQTAQQLKEELSKQLKNAIKTTYTSNSYYAAENTESQILYENMLDELERNITKKLQEIGASRGGYSYSYTFNNQQLNQLRKQLEKDLKLQFQQEVAGIRDNRSENNLGQEQIDQDVETPDLTQQIQDNTFGSHRKPTQQIVDVDLPQVEDTDGLTQQVEDNTFGLGRQHQIGQGQVAANINQQPEDSTEYLLTQQTLDNNSGKLQFGNQQVDQVEFKDTGLDSPQLGGQQEIVRPIDQGQVGQIQPTQYGHQFIPGGHGPVTRRPINSNNFLQREREELQNTNQYPFGQSQVNYNQRPNTLPTLNQVVDQQQQTGVNDYQEHNTDHSLVEPLRVPESDDLTQQQVDIGQQSIDDLTGGQTVDFPKPKPKANEDSNDEKILNSGQNILPTGQTGNQLTPSTGNQNLNVQVPLEQPGGQSFGVTGQGQFITQPQTLTDAESESDLLIQKLREAQRNNRGQASSGQGFNYVHYNRPVSYSQAVQYGADGRGRYTGESAFTGEQIPSLRPVQEQSPNQQQQSFDVYLNQQQAQFARQLESDLYKQLQDAISENYYVHSSYNPQLYQTTYQQLSKECNRNITKTLQDILNAGKYSPNYITYASLTYQQREKLLKQLQADLTRQLQQSLQVSNGYDLDHTQQSSLPSSGSSSYGSGHVDDYLYRPNSANSGHYGLGHTAMDRVHYGQQRETGGTIETVSELQPIQPQQADVVQNVYPHSNYNAGVKGHGRGYPRPYGRRQPSPSDAVNIYQPGVDVPSAANQNQLYGTPSQSPAAADLYQPDVAVPSAAVETPAAEVVAPVELVPPSQENPSPPLDQTVNQENLPWWKRFGNKVKHGAQSLKEKIVG